MADISKIKLANGTTVTIKDAQGRTNVTTLLGGHALEALGAAAWKAVAANITDTDERLINVKWNIQKDKKYPSDILVYTNTYDNLLDIITKASSNNMIIDSISTINKSEYKVYRMTVLVENKERLEKFMNDLLNLSFVQKVEREVK